MQRIPGNPREVKELGYPTIWYSYTKGRRKVTILEEEEIWCTWVEKDILNTRHKAQSNEKEEPTGCQLGDLQSYSPCKEVVGVMRETS